MTEISGVKKLSEDDWKRVKELRRISYHGERTMEKDEMEFLKTAYEEDERRYSQIGEDLREAYRDMFRRV